MTKLRRRVIRRLVEFTIGILAVSIILLRLGLSVEFVVLATFTVLLLAGSARTIIRVFEYRVAHLPVPLILWRDVFSRLGLALPFVLIFTARTLSLGPQLAGQEWWVLVTSIPAVVSVGVYAFFEFFIIDKELD